MMPGAYYYNIGPGRRIELVAFYNRNRRDVACSLTLQEEDPTYHRYAELRTERVVMQQGLRRLSTKAEAKAREEGRRQIAALAGPVFDAFNRLVGELACPRCGRTGPHVWVTYPPPARRMCHWCQSPHQILLKSCPQTLSGVTNIVYPKSSK